jgi:hypothetical protein
MMRMRPRNGMMGPPMLVPRRRERGSVHRVHMPPTLRSVDRDRTPLELSRL